MAAKSPRDSTPLNVVDVIFNESASVPASTPVKEISGCADNVIELNELFVILIDPPKCEINDMGIITELFTCTQNTYTTY
jgi:hypothetical protein